MGCRTMRIRILLTFTVGGLWVLSLASCGKSDGKQVISGSVTFQGKPMSRGMIEFEPLIKARPLTATAAVIVDGNFHIPRKDGLFPATYKVKVHAAIGPNDASFADVPKISSQYKEQSILRAEVEKGGPNRFDFSLQ